MKWLFAFLVVKYPERVFQIYLNIGIVVNIKWSAAVGTSRQSTRQIKRMSCKTYKLFHSFNDFIRLCNEDKSMGFSICPLHPYILYSKQENLISVLWSEHSQVAAGITARAVIFWRWKE